MTMGFDFQKTFDGVKLDGKVVFITGATYASSSISASQTAVVILTEILT